MRFMMYSVGCCEFIRLLKSHSVSPPFKDRRTNTSRCRQPFLGCPYKIVSPFLIIRVETEEEIRLFRSSVLQSQRCAWGIHFSWLLGSFVATSIHLKHRIPLKACLFACLIVDALCDQALCQPLHKRTWADTDVKCNLTGVTEASNRKELILIYWFGSQSTPMHLPPSLLVYKQGSHFGGPQQANWFYWISVMFHHVMKLTSSLLLMQGFYYLEILSQVHAESPNKNACKLNLLGANLRMVILVDVCG